MVAQSLYSHKELNGKNGDEKQEMIHKKGQNWDKYPASQKRGTTVVKRKFALETDDGDLITRSRWEIETPDFCKDVGVEYLEDVVPMNKQEVL
jgi:tRNA(His) 5'-end guanylyltransferase